MRSEERGDKAADTEGRDCSDCRESIEQVDKEGSDDVSERAVEKEGRDCKDSIEQAPTAAALLRRRMLLLPSADAGYIVV